jgi:hypothetical protein
MCIAGPEGLKNREDHALLLHTARVLTAMISRSSNSLELPELGKLQTKRTSSVSGLSRCTQVPIVSPAQGAQEALTLWFQLTEPVADEASEAEGSTAAMSSAANKRR